MDSTATTQTADSALHAGNIPSDPLNEATRFDPPIRLEFPGMEHGELIHGHKKHVKRYPRAEIETRTWYARTIQPNWLLIDAGANVGEFSIQFAKKASSGHVYAFEPTQTAAMLQGNLEHNGVQDRVSIIPKAVGKASGVHRDKVFRVWGHDAEELDYAFTTIDDFVHEQKLERLDVLKVDVDSYDLEVLQGATETLQRFNPWVVVELNHALSHRGQSVGQALRWMAEQGYVQTRVLDGENYLFKRGLEAEALPESVRCAPSLVIHWGPEEG